MEIARTGHGSAEYRSGQDNTLRNLRDKPLAEQSADDG